MMMIGVAPMLMLILVIPVSIGVYVYRDARRRNMEAALWTLVAVLAPALIGFIIYLLVRGNYSDLKCARCSATVKEEYTVCPKCGVKLCPVCGNCGMPVEGDWSVCPRCAQPLDGYEGNIAVPVRPKDHVLWKILIAVILIPVLLIILLILGLSASSQGGSCSVMHLTSEEYFAQQDNEEVKEWFASLDEESDKAYVLRYVHETGDAEYVGCYYLMYVPAAGEETELSFGYQGGLIQNKCIIELENCTMGEGMIYCIYHDYGEASQLKVYGDGEKLSCEVTDAAYNPTLFELTDDYGMVESVNVNEFPL